jgi:signal recognition particle subunit SRP19
MRSRKPFIIFWPQYFDAKRSRSKGRRIPKKFAIEKITTNDILEAAKCLGYEAHFEKGYHYPKTWWDDPGRVSINVKGKKKSKVLLDLAKEMKKNQSKK